MSKIIGIGFIILFDFGLDCGESWKPDRCLSHQWTLISMFFLLDVPLSVGPCRLGSRVDEVILFSFQSYRNSTEFGIKHVSYASKFLNNFQEFSTIFNNIFTPLLVFDFFCRCSNSVRTGLNSQYRLNKKERKRKEKTENIVSRRLYRHRWSQPWSQHGTRHWCLTQSVSFAGWGGISSPRTHVFFSGYEVAVTSLVAQFRAD